MTQFWSRLKAALSGLYDFHNRDRQLALQSIWYNMLRHMTPSSHCSSTAGIYSVMRYDCNIKACSEICIYFKKVLSRLFTRKYFIINLRPNHILVVLRHSPQQGVGEPRSSSSEWSDEIAALHPKHADNDGAFQLRRDLSRQLHVFHWLGTILFESLFGIGVYEVFHFF